MSIEEQRGTKRNQDNELDGIVRRNKKKKDYLRATKLRDIIDADFDEPQLKHIASKELKRLTRRIYDNE